MPFKEPVGTADLVCFDSGSETNGEEIAEKSSTNGESKGFKCGFYHHFKCVFYPNPK